MNIEHDLLQLARQRDATTDDALGAMVLEPPDRLRRQLRAYLSRLVDRGRMRRTDERIPRLATVQGGINELECAEAEFLSGARLDFRIKLEKQQRGWLVRQFRFHVRMPQARSIDMVRIHLNAQPWHDPLAVPRCHMHIGNSQAHVPFPAMDPRLILYLICEQIEPDVGA
jgi:hypothetical protein